MKGLVSHIQRYSTQDGPGIRTTVFMMGCNLNCHWCANPENLRKERTLLYFKNRCRRCGSCKEIEPSIVIDEQGCHFHPKEVNIEALYDICPYDAYEIVGTEMSVDELVQQCLKDKDFYEESNGGVTFSGGDGLFQFDFVYECAKRLKEQGIHVAIDTAAFFPYERIEKIFDYVDLFILDCKAFDSSIHKKCTDVDNELILSNIQKISENKTVWIRCIVVGGMNDNQNDIRNRLEFISKCSHVERVDILPFHFLAEGKYLALQKETECGQECFVDNSLLEWIQNENKRLKMPLFIKNNYK